MYLHNYVLNIDTIQVEELSARGMHEDAINLHALCAADAPEYVKGVEINR